MRSNSFTLCAAIVAMSFHAPALANSQNTVTVFITPDFSGGAGPYTETHTQPGFVSASGSTTGGFGSSGQGSCEVNYGYVRASGTASVSLSTTSDGIFRDSIVVTSPSVPNGTPGTLTYTIRVTGSLSATSGSSAASWHVQADIGGGVTDINKSGMQFSPQLGGGYTGNPLGLYSATIPFIYGNALQMHMQLSVTADASNSGQSSGAAAYGSPFVMDWQGMANFTANGNPVASVDISSESNTDWAGAINGQPCPADLNGDGQVDGADLGALLGSWGGTGSADLNNDGVVDGADLGALLGTWGDCP